MAEQLAAAYGNALIVQKYRQVARDILSIRTNAMKKPKPLISSTHIPSMSNSSGNPRVARPSQHQNPNPQSPEKIANTL
jgi:hypothetical protein